MLIVDDNALLAESFARLMRYEGHDVETAGDGAAGVQAARAFRPEVVFLDLGLPDMDGYEVARRLRSDPELEKVLIVAVTGYGQPADKRDAHRAGFEHHLVKPIQLDDVERILREYQDRKR
jgi:CheY-like chemotaxis protein